MAERNHQPISTWVIRIAVNSEVSTPTLSVQAKPRTGPVPNWNMIAAEISVVTLASMIETNANNERASMATRAPARTPTR